MTEKKKLSMDAVKQIEEVNKQIRIKQIELNRILSQEAERLDCPADELWNFNSQTMEFIKREPPKPPEGKK